MKTARSIAYVLLAIDVLVFVFYNRIMHATQWSVEKPLIVFVFANLGFVLLLTLYVFFIFKLSEPSHRKNIPLMVVVLLVGLFVWLNPLQWPLQNKVGLTGEWVGRGSSGRIVLYENGLFEIVWNGWARDGIYQGKWKKQNDHILLHYNGKRLDRVGDSLVLESNQLVPLNGYDDLWLKEVVFEISDQK